MILFLNERLSKPVFITIIGLEKFPVISAFRLIFALKEVSEERNEANDDPYISSPLAHLAKGCH